MLDHLRSLISEAFGTVRRPWLSIALTETGFLLLPIDQPGRTAKRAEWGEVTEIVAYKRDVLTYDLICLGITTVWAAFEIDEESTGWDLFIQAVEQNLAGSLAVDAWWPKVTFPAFATNQTTIYRKIT